ncbi:hypothetical protein LI168_11995 [Desulfovibrio desulfuricans]|uniref:hypothetical protein n=1 Tax=Desulfovibrio TaxID=872 RepID=UPI001D06F5E8|nr:MULTISPECIES: hypothetical protein [Desulfovibrio]MCB6542959.1 hypothetical protein [Desulfovibrio desulfuricans]MCB6553946.1 hypothetical protein [Desulfovibrio desulfuricans]MCB6565928.1 hypothetical protein [Desulfovibrio desulfuricans]MCB7346990.1 hypothetical protein [Desulfovibrio desulfuricans]MCQ4861952.1 hypothetical protein [Desulfovibrio desulfuricans]
MIVSLWRSVTLRQRLLQLRFENSIQSYLICQEITAEKSLFSAHALALHAPQPYHSLQGSKTVQNRLLAAALLFAFF